MIDHHALRQSKERKLNARERYEREKAEDETRYQHYLDTGQHISNEEMMASACLMIESLEAFWWGWPDTRGKSEEAFDGFFDREESFNSFREFNFYRDIRCGILHQSETRNGWRIRRDLSCIVDLERKIIDANCFHKELECYIDAYVEKLKNEAWEDEIWKNFRKKMDAICENTKAAT